MVDTSISENRLRKFASFFKGYMGVMPIVTAAVAPILTMMKAIPVFESQRTTLATYSGVLGFLLLAWVFYARRVFVRAMVPEPTDDDFDYVAQKIRLLAGNILPLILIISSIACFMYYQYALEEAIGKAQAQIALINSNDQGNSASMRFGDGMQKTYLENWGQSHPIYRAAELQAYYLGIFLFAECAFVVMALREYGYGVLGISEEEVLRGRAISCEPWGSKERTHKK